MPDDERNRSGRSFGEGYSYVALGFSFAFAILAFGALGWLVDGWLGTRPLFALVGAGLGGLGGMGVRALALGLVLAGAATHRAALAPLPASLGFLGVLLPLLFLETRFLR